MPEVIYKGLRYSCVLSDKAMKQIGFNRNDIDFPKKICGEDSKELLARIVRYCDGIPLNEPLELNNEGPYFWAIKTARPESLRAYFFHDEDYNGENMVITHFIKKTTQKLTLEDKTKMKLIRDEYIRNGGV